MRKSKFIGFYNQYAPRIYRFVYLKLNSREDSEDLTSEAFFSFWRKFARKERKIRNPRALVYKIAANLVVDFYRKKPKKALNIDPENNPVLSKIRDKTDLNKKVELNSDVAEIKGALAKIKNEYQDVIIWRYLDELSIREIAQIAGKSENSIRVLSHRALKALKKQL